MEALHFTSGLSFQQSGGKMFISNQKLSQNDDSEKPLVCLGKLVLVIAANVILARFGGSHLTNNIRF